MHTIECKSCQNTSEIKVASGFKDPKNKGRKYYKCIKCSFFDWIDKQPNVAPSMPVVAPKTAEVTREAIIEPKIDPKVWIDKDLRIARESALHSVSRNHMGKEVDPALMILEAEEFVKYIYNGLKSDEDIEDVELPSEALAIADNDKSSTAPLV